MEITRVYHSADKAAEVFKGITNLTENWKLVHNDFAVGGSPSGRAEVYVHFDKAAAIRYLMFSNRDFGDQRTVKIRCEVTAQDSERMGRIANTIEKRIERLEAEL